MRLRGIKNHGTVVLHHHYRKASGHQWNPNWEQDDSFRWVASSGSSHGVMVISSGTQQKEQKSSAEFCGFTFIILSQIICHDYITLCIYIYTHHIYIYNHIYISYRFGMWYFGSFWVDFMEQILHSAFAVRLGILVQLPKSLQLLQHHSEGR